MVDEVLLAQIEGIDAHLPRGDFHQPLDHESRLRAPRPAVGVNRGRICIDSIDLAVDRRDGILTGEERGVEICRNGRREGRHVGAEIGNRLHAQAQNFALIVQSHLRARNMIAAMSVGQERLRTTGNPSHRPADPSRCPQADHFLGIDEDLGAEPSTHIRRYHAQLVLGRHAHECGDHKPGDVRVLRRIPERKRIGACIVLADGRARLDRIRHQPIVDELQPGHMLGRLDCAFGRSRISKMPAVNRVLGSNVVDLRSTLRLRLRRIDDRVQQLIIHFHLLCGIHGLRESLGNDHGHRIADEVGFAMRNGGMRRHLHGGAVLGGDHPPADETADLVGREIRASEHRQHSRHCTRSGGIDSFDVGVGMRRAQHEGISLPRTGNVIGVVGSTGDEAVIFFPAHWRADPGCAHGWLLPYVCSRLNGRATERDCTPDWR